MLKGWNVVILRIGVKGALLLGLINPFGNTDAVAIDIDKCKFA